MPFPIKLDVAYETPAQPHDGLAVSVIITLYNYESFIEGALDSVRLQTFGPIELIVVDDCSKDDSVKRSLNWLKANSGRFVKVKQICHRENYGLAQARNTAFEAATNEYVFVLDADNEIKPFALEKLLSACERAKTEAAYSQLEKFGERAGLGDAESWNPDLLARGNYIDAMALIKKSAWRAVGCYSAMEIEGWEDYDLWCKFVGKKYSAVFVQEPLCRYRVHGTSLLNIETNPQIAKLKLDMMVRHPWLTLS